MSGFDLDEVIDPNEVDTSGTEFDVIRPGKHPAHLIEYEEEKTKTGGVQHVLTWEIVEGKYEKRRVWDRVNYKNGSDEARRLARVHYAKLATAIGEPQLRSLEQALFKPVMIDIAIDKDKSGQYPDKNVVRPGGISPYGAGNSRPDARAANRQDDRRTRERQPDNRTNERRDDRDGRDERDETRSASGRDKPWERPGGRR